MNCPSPAMGQNHVSRVLGKLGMSDPDMLSRVS